MSPSIRMMKVSHKRVGLLFLISEAAWNEWVNVLFIGLTHAVYPPNSGGWTWTRHQVPGQHIIPGTRTTHVPVYGH